MKRPPEEFIDEYWQMRERMGWAEEALGNGNDVAQGKTLMDEFRGFCRRWHPVITIQELREGMETMLAHMEKTLGRNLERIFWAHLNEVVEARKEWFQQEAMFRAMMAIIKLRKEMPEPLRDGFEKILTNYAKGEFVAEHEFRDCEKDAAEAETKYRHALAGLEIDWPERVDAALRERLEKLDAEGAKAWEAEIGLQTEKLGDKKAA